MQAGEVGQGKIVCPGKSEAKGWLVYLRMHIAEHGQSKFAKRMLACDTLSKETSSCLANSELEMMSRAANAKNSVKD
jgi:hypothetical protein